MGQFHLCLHDESSGDLFVCNSVAGFCKKGMCSVTACPCCKLSIRVPCSTLSELIDNEGEGDPDA